MILNSGVVNGDRCKKTMIIAVMDSVERMLGMSEFDIAMENNTVFRHVCRRLNTQSTESTMNICIDKSC